MKTPSALRWPLAATFALWASAAAAVDVHVNIGTPPPPPTVYFEREPDVVLVPRTHVYYVPKVVDYDVYRVGPHWYVNRDGYWYRANSYRGPFTYVEHRAVPRSVFVVPVEYRHHPGHPHGWAPGHAKHHKQKHGHGHGKHGD
jgi:hypothetical protein